MWHTRYAKPYRMVSLIRFIFFLGCVMYLLFRCPCSSSFSLVLHGMGVYNNKSVLLLWAGILGVGSGLHCGNK